MGSAGGLFYFNNIDILVLWYSCMTVLKDKVHEVVVLIYQGTNIEENYSLLCKMMIPVIRQCADPFIRRMDDYDFNDFLQEAYITIWNIVLVKKPIIRINTFEYLRHAIWYEFIDLFYRYVTKNGCRKYLSEDDSSGLTIYNYYVASWIERRKKKARERYLEKYVEEHGHLPIKHIPLSVEEKKRRQREYNRKYFRLNYEKISFIVKERRRMEREHIIFGKRISATQIVTDCGEKRFIIVEGTKGRLPYSATMSKEEYLAYLETKAAREKSRKIYYSLICQHCGKEFRSCNNKHKKYCCHDCYNQHRYGK